MQTRPEEAKNSCMQKKDLKSSSCNYHFINHYKMMSFENRLTSKQISRGGNQPLKGKELANYIKDHKNEFNKNGDALCVEAGYGDYAKDGTPLCNFEPFVKELGKVVDLESEDQTN